VIKMASYATVNDVQNRTLRKLSNDELNLAKKLLQDAAVIIDLYAPGAQADAKKIVSCRMVLRVLGDGEDTGVPVGANQGTQSALGYSQTWSYPTTGSSGELYLAKMEKQMLKKGNTIGSRSPVEDLVPEGCFEEMD
jgi:hypothetical protein